MAKKIQPKDQTEELNNARLEFILRNKEESQKLRELVGQNEKKRDEITTALASITGKFNPEQKERWDFLYKNSEVPFDKEFAEYINKIEVPKAVNSVWRWLDYNMEIQYQRMANEENYSEGIPINLSHDEMKKEIIDMHCRDARGIFAELMNGRPAVHLLMGIDLSRNKGVILGEVEKLVTEYQTKLGVHEIPEKRFKWLSIVDEYLKVWDLRLEGNSFAEISTLLSIGLDTAKKRFRRVFPLIAHTDYGKDVWKDLVREHLEYMAKTAKPTDKKFWNQVKKIESISQKDFIPRNTEDEDGNKGDFFESIGREGQYDLGVLVADLKKICLSCPDTACQADTLKCLSEFEAGGMEAFEDFQPDCPKIYNYLKD